MPTSTSTPRSRSRSTSVSVTTGTGARSQLSSTVNTDDPAGSGTSLSAAAGHVALGTSSQPQPTSSSRPKLSPSLSYSSVSISPAKHTLGPSASASASVGRSTHSPIPGAKARGARVRSRTSTISYTPPLAPVMSRENSLEEPSTHLHLASSLPPASQTLQLPTPPPTGGARAGRKASKSVSNARPSLGSVTPQRTTSYHSPSLSAEQPTAPIPSLLFSPTDGNNPRKGLKRRISTPSLAAQREEAEAGPSEVVTKQEDTRTRARSTSTSLVIPDQQPKQPPANAAAGPSNLQHASSSSSSKQPNPAAWNTAFVHPTAPVDPASTSASSPFDDLTDAHPRSTRRDVGLLTSAYDLGESSILRLSRWILPSRSHRPSRRRGSDEDSEKGLDPNDEDMTADSAASNAASRTSEDSIRRNGRYWGMWQNGSEEEEEGGGYFSLPPTPPEEKPPASLAEFQAALDRSDGVGATLPTPALSTRSLSRHGSKRRSRSAVDREEPVAQGWLTTVLNIWTNLGSRRRSGGKTAEVLRDLGWTVALLIGLFLVTAGTALWMIQALPITQLKHVPTSTTDLQLLSAEIRSYMASSDVGYWHTVGVLTFVGCWKHAWSVPGAVVLNILVGSVLEPMPALLLLTLITATGSLFSYLLCRPLAPLISVLFPKPLALVRAALAPDQVPHPPAAEAYEMDEKVTAIQVSPNPAAPAIGGESKGSVWRRLLIMRAMGFVPWSGMNVACGVVNVDWKIFWLTTAAGSASWSYVTASVGNILSRLAIPPAALEGGASGEMIDGESLTSLLRDPVLIAKLVFLSGLTLLPVVLKRRRNGSPTAEAGVPRKDVISSRLGGLSSAPFSPISPGSPLSQSLARFTPTPAAFDLLSFGRTALRQGGRVVVGTTQSAVGSVRRVLSGYGSGGV